MEIEPILLDMDGVFCDFAGGYYAVARRTDPELYAELIKPAEQTNYYLHDHITDPEMHLRGEAIANYPKLFDILPPYEGAIEGVQLLDKLAARLGIDVLICTAPHTTNKGSYTAKANWIEHYLGARWLDKTLMVRDKTIVRGSVLIDDKPIPLGKHVPHWKHVVMPHAYNREQQKTNFVFPGWQEDQLENLLNYVVYVSQKG